MKFKKFLRTTLAGVFVPRKTFSMDLDFISTAQKYMPLNFKGHIWQPNR